MRVLVAYGSKRGGTEGLARAVGEGLAETGHTVDVRTAHGLERLDRWDAVVVGGALYPWFWHRDARRFVKRNVEELQQRPVWFFSSGPLDDSPNRGEVAPPGSVARLAKLVNAKEHTTFGGRLLPDDESAVKVRGDFRDLNATRAWGRQVGLELSALPVRPRVPVPPGMSTLHRLVLGLCAFTGLTAVGGGIGLLVAPKGSPLVPPLSLLEHTPFDTYLIPALVLLLVVGVGNLVAAALELRRLRGSELAVLLAGAALTGWIVTQLVMVRTLSWLQFLYFLAGIVTVSAGISLWRNRHRLAAQPPPWPG